MRGRTRALVSMPQPHPLHAVGLGVMPPLIVFLVAVLDLYFVHKAAEAVTKIDVDSVTPRGTQSVATVAVATPMWPPTAVATATVVSNS